MSLFGMLCDVYDNCKSEILEKSENKSMLFPVSHLTAIAQIDVFLNSKGDFVRAEPIPKENGSTLIPVTEDSASRSSGISPMPLCDKLCYVAGDYDEYFKPDKSMESYYAAYIEQLRLWAEAPETPEDVKVIYRYLKKGSLMKDLTRDEKKEIVKTEGDFVRFTVVPDREDENVKGVWEKKEIIESFISYYQSKLDCIGIDYITGQETELAGKLPAKIRNSGDKAKLISSNDTSGFTYRGRFIDASQAVGIGYLSGQKAHNALRWLIANQGYQNDTESIVCFSDGKSDVPHPCRFTLGSKEEAQGSDTRESYARQVNMAIAGFRKKLRTDDTDKVTITSVNATNNSQIEKKQNDEDLVAIVSVDTADGALQGRLAVNYYSEMPKDDFLDNLEKWQLECAWMLTYPKLEKGIFFRGIAAPLPKDIILAAYGTEQNGMLALDGKVLKKNIDRIMPCITQRKKMPKDIMRILVINAGEPQRYSKYNANKILEIACAVIRKCRFDDGKKGDCMSLNYNLGRSYLFGCLLAVFNKIEESALFSKENRDENEKRITNAKKFWSMFVRKPAKTSIELQERVNPYMDRLSRASQNFYSEILEKIFGRLGGDAFNNDSLDELYLLGYYHQYAELRKWKKEEKENGEADE